MLIKDPPVEIVENLWMLGTSLYPLYLLKGGRGGTIVEGGTGAMGPVLREQLTQLGIAADYVRQVIVTHAHPDHVMAVPLFREMFPGVQVIASATAWPPIRLPWIAWSGKGTRSKWTRVSHWRSWKRPATAIAA